MINKIRKFNILVKLFQRERHKINLTVEQTEHF